MPDRVRELLDEFAVRFRRGENPDLREYLERAGPDADALAALADAFLQAVPPPAPSEEAVALARTWAEGASPLLALRTERRLRRADVVDALMGALGLGEERREKLRLRYHELETGQLEPARVDRRVWEVLAETLRARVEELRAWTMPERPRASPAAYYRLDSMDATGIVRERQVEEQEPDEVDVLFGLGPRT